MAEPDPTALTAQLDAAVRQHLPEKVGKLLRERLDQLEALEAQIATQAKRIGLLDIKAKAAENIARREEDVARREEDVAAVEAELAERQQDVAIKEAVCETREKTYGDMKEITLAVFANSKFKYDYAESGMAPVRDTAGYISQESTSRGGTVEGEGAPPAKCP